MTDTANTSNDGEASTEAKPDRKPMKDLKGVRFTGRSNVMILTREDMKRVGVDGLKVDLQWDEHNGHVVPIADVNAAAVDYFEGQPDFVVE